MKKKNKLLVDLFVVIGLTVVFYFVASYWEFKAIVFSVDVFKTWQFLALTLGILSLFIVMRLRSNWTSTPFSGKEGVGKTKEGDTMSQYFDSRFITPAELKSEPRFRYNTWDTLKNEKKDGVLIRSLVEHGKLNINFANPIHTMIIGTTGSGKTTLYIDPSIRIFSKTAAKPCMVITDPKGELYNNHSIQLKEQGYRVMVLDLRQPFSSTRWNPLANAYNKYHDANNLEKQVKIHKGDNPAQSKLRVISNTYNNEWYEFDGVAFPNAELLKNDIASKRQILRDEAENELREVSANIVTIESKHDASWERGAQDFLYGLMLAMLEDSMEPEETGMTLDKFNFYNLAKMAMFKDPDPDNPFGTLRDYCSGRSQLSKVMSLTSAVVNNAPNTSKSYMGVLQPKIAVFQDMGVCYATSWSDMSFDDFTDQPTALFIKVPDEKENRHCIATMCISQLYKKLIETAGKTEGLALKRPVHFLLDEFANLPKIEKMDSLITVGRSRKIYFHLVVQSYSQLDNKYGKEGAEIIRGNCNIQIYIGTDDQKTKEDFSKLCGDVSLTMETKSSSRNERREDGNSRTTNTQLVTRPLIIPYELGQLPPSTVIVKIFKENPIKTLFTPWFKTPQFDQRKAQDLYTPGRPLDEAKIFFDMKNRNNRVLKKKKPSFDDFDF